MQITILESTALARISYDEITQCLEAEFRDRTIYQYCGVPPEVHAALLGSESKGRFLNATIRGHFPHQLISAAS
jgi:hypothetical protein